MKHVLYMFCFILALGGPGPLALTWAEEEEFLVAAEAEGAGQLEFAEHLFQEGDYFRAIGEYKRFLFHFPNAGEKQKEEAYFKIAMSYYRAQHWEEAINSFNVFLERFPGASKRSEALFYKGRAEHELGFYEDALSSYEVLARSDVSELRNKALFESAMVYIDLNQWDDAAKALARISDQSALKHRAGIVSEGLENVDNLPSKSPVSAGVFAAMIPGAGHVYTENYRDGLVAFLLNGLFIWAAIEQFEDDNEVTGGIITFFELGWYTGNIYSAVGSAHKFNERVEEGFIRSLKERGRLSIVPGENGTDHHLAFTLRF